MTSDMEKWNDKIQWVRNGFLHGKDFDKEQPIVDDFDLSDENLLQVLTCLEKYRKENHLNEGLEYLKSNNKQNFWIAYYSLDEQETKEYDNFCYFNLVSDFVKTKVLKAKVLGKWSECCESIKIHRINENRIFAGFIKNCDCLTDGEKDQILNRGRIMEDIEILKENVKEAFKNRDNFDFSDTHLNEIIDSINSLIGKTELYEKLEEFKNKNYPDFQLACYFLPDEYLEYYYNHEYGDYLTESTNIKILKAKDFPLAKSLQEMKPFQENSFLEVVEKHMHNSNVPTVSKQY